MIYEISDAAPADCAAGTHFTANRLHGGGQNLRVRHADNFHICQFAHGPGGIVINTLLRIARAPVLVIKHCVSDAAVGLVHTHKIAAGWERARLSFDFLLWRAARYRKRH